MEAAKKIIVPGDFDIPVFETENKVIYIGIPGSFKASGQPLFSAPLIIINYGVSKKRCAEASKNLGNIIGSGKFIDPNKHAIIEFEIPSDQSYSFTYESYKHFSNNDLKSIIDFGIRHYNLPEPSLIYNI